jgi:phosphohistidine phosphatase
MQARQLAQTLARRGFQLDAVMTTPLVRARRTAEILLENWTAGPAPDLIVEPRIAPECKPRKLLRALRELQKERVAVVGHQPDIGAWASWFIGSKKAYIDFAKGGAAYIYWESELKKGGGALIWLVTPVWYDEAPASAKLAAVGE